MAIRVSSEFEPLGHFQDDPDPCLIHWTEFRESQFLEPCETIMITRKIRFKGVLEIKRRSIQGKDKNPLRRLDFHLHAFVLVRQIIVEVQDTG